MVCVLKSLEKNKIDKAWSYCKMLIYSLSLHRTPEIPRSYEEDQGPVHLP